MIKLLFYAKTVIKINKAYVHYIQNIESITKNISCQKLFEIEKVIDSNIEFLKEKNLLFLEPLEIHKIKKEGVPLKL